MRGVKRGQASTEFLVSYGWVLLLLITAIVVMVLYTNISKSTLIGEECDIALGFSCSDFYVDEGSINMVVKNNLDWDLGSVKFTFDDCVIDSNERPLETGESATFSLAECSSVSGEFFKSKGLFVNYTFAGSNTIEHQKSVSITTVVEGGNSQSFGGGSGGGYNPDGATALLYKFDEGDGGSIGDEGGNGYDGILISQGELVDNDGAETGDTTNFINVDGVTNSDSNSGIYSFYEEGGKSLKSDEFIPIDLDTVYNLKGWFKSYGSPSNSKLYFGYTPYDGNQQIIKREEIQPFVGTETTLYADVNAQDMIIKVIDASIWDTSTYHAVVAFNIDDSGNYNDLPNRELSNRMGINNVCNPTKNDMGGHWEVSFCGGQTVGEDYFAGTKVRQHKSGGTYMYDGASNVYVPNTWTEYSGSTQGENVYGGAIGKWWRGTRYAKILFLLNHKTASSNIENKTRFDDISLTAVPIQYSNKWNSGYYGSAVNFNGVDDCVDSNIVSLGLADQLTVEAWVYPRKFDADRRIVQKNSNFGLYLSGSSLTFFTDTQDTTGSGGWKSIPHTLSNTDEWYHVAGVYDGSEMRFYVDGVQVLNSPISQSGVLDSTAELYVGCDGGSKFFDGLIDEVRISDYARYT